jgi:Ca2+-binding RTX toxin-like protein
MAVITPVTYKGDVKNNTKKGGGGNDSMSGLAGADTLDGVGGNDSIDGGTGNDSLLGGDGSDTLLGGEGSDTLSGGSGNDKLYGGNDNDIIDGGTGNDTLDGGTGADKMTGGEGNDYYFIDNAGDKIIELVTTANNAKPGISDTVETALSVYTLAENVEILKFAKTATTGTGNKLNNKITGNDANNSINGGDGNDTLEGGNGNDTAIFNSSQDDYQITYDADFNEIMVEYIGDVTNEGIDTLINIEYLAFVDVPPINASDLLPDFFPGEYFHAPVNSLPTGDIQISGELTDGQTLTASNSISDADGLGAFNYAWLRNGKTISGATKATYTLSENDIGTAISVKVSYTDGLKKMESVTSGTTDLIESKPEEFLPPTYTLTVDKTSVNEGDTVTFKLVTENVVADTEILFNFGGSISNADVLGGLKTNSFVVDASGKASLAVKFLADKVTDSSTENLTLTLNSGESQSVLVKDTSIEPAPVVKPVVPVIEQPAVVVKPITENTSTSTIKADGRIETAPSNANKLLIGSAKNDLLTGLAGADTLRGDAGQDFLDGGLGNDSLESGNGDDTLIGGGGNDKLIAGSDNDKLEGGKGNDTLEGGLGKDTLDGGVGTDSMNGGDGDDYYFVDNAKDVVVESNANVTTGGKDTIKSTSSTYTLGENIENLILDDVPGKGNNGIGNSGNNIITGSIGDNALYGMANNDTLEAGEGADTLDGGLGMDMLIGGNGDDLYIMNNIEDNIVENVGGGEADQVISLVDFNLAQSENVEFLTLSGVKAVIGEGNALNNLLQEIAGGKTNNNFEGNEGNDTINGEGGDDTLKGGDGNDELNGGKGVDVAVFDGVYSDYQITVNVDAKGVPQLTLVQSNSHNTGIFDGTDVLNDIEILEFADGDQHNKADVLKDNNFDVTETESSSMLILTGVVVE